MSEPPKFNLRESFRALFRCEGCRTLFIERTSLKEVRCACGEDHWLCLACRSIEEIPECPQAKRTAQILMR